MKSHPSERARHLILRAEPGDVLPDALLEALSRHDVSCGWLRASGVLREVELRAFDAELAGPAQARRITGPVQAIAIEGSIGRARGETSAGLRAVLARETESGMETIAGEIVGARVVALEAWVTAFDDLALGRALDPQAGVWLLGDASAARYRPEDEPQPAAARGGGASAGGRAATTAAAPAAPAGWGEAFAASAEADQTRPAARGTSTGGAAMPMRPQRVRPDEPDSVFPEAGDAVEHFAFGRADVLRSDGERLHLKVHKDGRIREIALEMLKVTPLESNGPRRRFKLDRKL